MAQYTNPRGAERFKVKLPVHLEDGTGITRDVSRTGVYFYTDRTISPGNWLDFLLELQFALPDEPVRLHCSGKVVRVEAAGKKNGVAVSLSNVRGTF